MRKTLFYLLGLGLWCGCRPQEQQLEAGPWRGVLQRSDGIEIPFQFEVRDTAGHQVIDIVNGAGRLRVDSLRFSGDSVYIHMPFFDSDFQLARSADHTLQGRWVKHYPTGDKSMQFTASPGVTYRLRAHVAAPRHDVTGRWSTLFTEGGDTTAAVGEFAQQDSLVTGTFLTTSGDYRFLAGVMDGDTLRLSTFDGSNVYLFQAVAGSDRTLEAGEFYAGFAGHASWSAYKDSAAYLPDAFALTKARPGEHRLAFTFPDLDGHAVSLGDDRFRNKVVVIQIMGSWCPNCMDETAFMSGWYAANHHRGVEVVGLCYERATDFDDAVRKVMEFKNRFDVGYPLLITGVKPGDPQLLEKTLPQLQGFAGFPTTIFLNKAGDIARIHAGFSGPGTGKHYKQYIAEVNHLVDSLLAE